MARGRFSTASRPSLGPTQPPLEWVPGALSQGVKRQGHEADHSHVLRTFGEPDMRTPIRDLHLAFQIPYVYYYINKLRRKQA
jgi:hypothetical protein